MHSFCGMVCKPLTIVPPSHLSSYPLSFSSVPTCVHELVERKPPTCATTLNPLLIHLHCSAAKTVGSSSSGHRWYPPLPRLAHAGSSPAISRRVSCTTPAPLLSNLFSFANSQADNHPTSVVTPGSIVTCTGLP